VIAFITNMLEGHRKDIITPEKFGDNMTKDIRRGQKNFINCG